MSEAEKDTREWRCVELRDGLHDGLYESKVAADASFLVVPKSALTAALEERDALADKRFAGVLRQVEERAGRAEAALAEALDLLNHVGIELPFGAPRVPVEAFLRKHGRLSS